jgi:hypothetical protein
MALVIAQPPVADEGYCADVEKVVASITCIPESFLVASRCTFPAGSTGASASADLPEDDPGFSGAANDACVDGGVRAGERTHGECQRATLADVLVPVEAPAVSDVSSFRLPAEHESHYVLQYAFAQPPGVVGGVPGSWRCPVANDLPTSGAAQVRPVGVPTDALPAGFVFAPTPQLDKVLLPNGQPPLPAKGKLAGGQQLGGGARQRKRAGPRPPDIASPGKKTKPQDLDEPCDLPGNLRLLRDPYSAWPQRSPAGKHRPGQRPTVTGFGYAGHCGGSHGGSHGGSSGDGGGAGSDACCLPFFDSVATPETVTTPEDDEDPDYELEEADSGEEGVAALGGDRTTMTWEPNVHELVMGPGQRRLVGRCLRVRSGPDAPDLVYFEPPFFSVCICFSADVVEQPGVVFRPMFQAPGADGANSYVNSPPPLPPGVFVQLERQGSRRAPGGTGYAEEASMHDNALGYLVVKVTSDWVRARAKVVQDPVDPEWVMFVLDVPVFARVAYGGLASCPDRGSAASRLKAAVGYAAQATGVHVVLPTPSGSTRVQAVVAVASHVLDGSPAVWETRAGLAPGSDTCMSAGPWQPTWSADCALDSLRWGACCGGGPPPTGCAAYADDPAPSSAGLAGELNATPVSAALVTLAADGEPCTDQVDVVATWIRVVLGAAPVPSGPVVCPTGEPWWQATLDALLGLPENCAAAAVGDVLTRVLWDAAMWDPCLAVATDAAITALALFSDRSPAQLNVRCAKHGLPMEVTKGSTSVTNAMRRLVADGGVHPAMPATTLCAVRKGSGKTVLDARKRAGSRCVGACPPDVVSTAAWNPFVRAWLWGPCPVWIPPGMQASPYVQGSQCRALHLTGNMLSWPVYAALVDACASAPQTEAEPWGFFPPGTGEAVGAYPADVLIAPLHNAIRAEVWKDEGAWRNLDRKGVVLRQWRHAYRVKMTDLHRAFGALVYPGFAWDLVAAAGTRHGSLCGVCTGAAATRLDVWKWKMASETYAHLMARHMRVMQAVAPVRKQGGTPATSASTCTRLAARPQRGLAGLLASWRRKEDESTPLAADAVLLQYTAPSSRSYLSCPVSQRSQVFPRAPTVNPAEATAGCRGFEALGVPLVLATDDCTQHVVVLDDGDIDSASASPDGVLQGRGPRPELLSPDALPRDGSSLFTRADSGWPVLPANSGLPVWHG